MGEIGEKCTFVGLLVMRCRRLELRIVVIGVVACALRGSLRDRSRTC